MQRESNGENLQNKIRLSKQKICLRRFKSLSQLNLKNLGQGFGQDQEFNINKRVKTLRRSYKTLKFDFQRIISLHSIHV